MFDFGVKTLSKFSLKYVAIKYRYAQTVRASNARVKPPENGGSLTFPITVF